MKLTERIRNYNQLEITLLAVFVSTLLSLGIVLSYIYQGFTGIYSNDSDEYYGAYGANVDGSFPMDMLITVLLTAVLVTIALTIKKKQSRFLLLAIIFSIILIPISQSSIGYTLGVIICIFGFVYMKREERNPYYQPKKTYIETVAFSLYVLDAIFYGIPLVGYLIDVIPSSAAPDLSGSFKGDAPDWVFWGLESGNPGVNIFDLIIGIAPFILFLTAAVFMYRAIRGRGYKWCRLAAASFLLYPFIFLSQYGEMGSFVLLFFMPEALLSIYLLFRRAPRMEELHVTQTPIKSLSIYESETGIHE